jgi:hypothetical protein
MVVPAGPLSGWKLTKARHTMRIVELVAILQNASNPRLILPCVKIPKAIEQAARGATGWPHGAGFRLDYGIMYYTSTGYNGYAVGLTQLVTTTTTHAPGLDAQTVVVDGSFTLSMGTTPPDAHQQVTVTAQLVFVTAAGVIVELDRAVAKTMTLA